MSKIYYVEVEDYELDNIENKIRQHIIELVAKDIVKHSKELAVSIIQSKPLTKKKWYQNIKNKGTKS